MIDEKDGNTIRDILATYLRQAGLPNGSHAPFVP